MDIHKISSRVMILAPLAAAGILSLIPGFAFSAFLLVMVSLVIFLYAILPLFKKDTEKLLRRVLNTLVYLAVLIGMCTEGYLIANTFSRRTPCDYVVVLGAGVNGTEPSLMLQNRIDRAFEYLTEHPKTICVVSGGQGDDETITEAECMYRELVKMGIPRNRIWKEEASSNTQENLKNAAALIEKRTGKLPDPIGIVSNEFHISRAKLMARDQGLNPIGIPAKTSWISLRINYYLREGAALWKYLILGGKIK